MKWYAKGLFIKQEVPGNSIAASVANRIEAGDIVYNKLFAWKGSFGVADAQVSGAYGSNEFPTFRADESEVNLDFLRYCMSRRSFWHDAELASQGSSRQSRLRLKESQFLNLQIPLPPPPVQVEIVRLVKCVEALVLRATRLRSEADDELDSVLRRLTEEISKRSPRESLRLVAPIVRRWVDPDESQDYPELGIRSFGKGTFHKPAIRGSDLNGKRILEIHPGDLLFSNVFAWEGAIAVAREEDAGRFGSHRYITCVVDSRKASASFLRHYFLSDEGLKQVRAASPGAAGRNKTLGLTKLESTLVPVPNQDDLTLFDKMGSLTDRYRRLTSDIPDSLDVIVPAMFERIVYGS
jgi:type I restriction enzyme S subunit